MSVIDSVKLPNGDEFDVMAKLDGATNGNLAAYDQNENLVDSGVAVSDVLVKNAGATDGHIVSYDENGNIEDSGVAVSDLIVKNAGATDGHIASYDENGDIEDSGVAVSHIGDIDDEIEAIVNVYGSKNLNSYPYYGTSYSSDGITFTDLGNGIVKATGTASADLSFVCHQKGITEKFCALENGDYKITGCPSGGSDSSYYIRVGIQNQNNQFEAIAFDYGNGATFTIDGDYYATDKAYIQLFITIKSGTELPVDGVEFKLMIRDARIKDDTYAPYAPTNRELMSYKANGRVGAKNLNSYPYYHTTRTNNGITYTDNGDGTVKVGTSSAQTATANSSFYCHDAESATGKVYLPNGTYIINGCPSGGNSESGYSLQLAYKNPSNSLVYIIDIGNGAIFTINGSYGNANGANCYFFISVKNGYTIPAGGNTFKPMIRIAEDTDDIFQPYTMTNKELTEFATEQVISASDFFTPESGYTFSGTVLKRGNTIIAKLDVTNTSGIPSGARTKIGEIKEAYRHSNNSSIVVAVPAATTANSYADEVVTLITTSVKNVNIDNFCGSAVKSVYLYFVY